MPRPRRLGTRKIWDVKELDISFMELPREGEFEGEGDTWDDL